MRPPAELFGCNGGLSISVIAVQSVVKQLLLVYVHFSNIVKDEFAPWDER